MNIDELRASLNAIRSEIAELNQGSKLIVETLQTQTEMLDQILEAATKKPEKSELTEVLEQILSTLDVQTDSLVRFGKSLDGIAPSVEGAVMRGLHRAMGATDDDVIQEDQN